MYCNNVKIVLRKINKNNMKGDDLTRFHNRFIQITIEGGFYEKRWI